MKTTAKHRAFLRTIDIVDILDDLDEVISKHDRLRAAAQAIMDYEHTGAVDNYANWDHYFETLRTALKVTP
jgi:hypothetical protein